MGLATLRLIPGYPLFTRGLAPLRTTVDHFAPRLFGLLYSALAPTLIHSRERDYSPSTFDTLIRQYLRYSVVNLIADLECHPLCLSSVSSLTSNRLNPQAPLSSPYSLTPLHRDQLLRLVRYRLLRLVPANEQYAQHVLCCLSIRHYQQSCYRASSTPPSPSCQEHAAPDVGLLRLLQCRFITFSPSPDV